MVKPLLTEEANLSVSGLVFFFPLSLHEKEGNVCRSLSQEIAVITIRKPIQIETAFTLILVLILILY